MTRTDRIAATLDRTSAVRSWYCSSPDGRRRWVIEWRAGVGTRVLTTAQAEAVADALDAVHAATGATQSGS